MMWTWGKNKKRAGAVWNECDTFLFAVATSWQRDYVVTRQPTYVI